jgi:hypothetical protein
VTEERRYTDEEVEEIFRTASSEAAGRRSLPAREGPTLAELQTIGAEVGMSAEQIAAAAARLDLPVAVGSRRAVLGMPTAVGRTVDLPRAPTDREWGILVGELRETFAAQGRESSGSGLRSWNNGNLRVAIEPTETGHRLRMTTRKGSAATGIGASVILVLLAVLPLLGVGGAEGLRESILLALVGLGIFSYQAVSLPSWATERSAQMEAVAARTVELLSRPPAEAASPPDPG